MNRPIDAQESTLGIDSRIADWLDDPVGGPLLRGVLLPAGADPALLDMVSGLSLRRLVEVGQGALSRETASELVRAATGVALTDDDFSIPPAPGVGTAALLARHPHLTAVTFADVVIAGPHGDVAAREYSPAEAPVAAFVWLHGGGFVAGDLDMPEAHWVALELASRGIHVLSVDYRKVGDGVTYPVPGDDVLAAWNWAVAHLGERLPLLLGGASAGSALAAALAVRLRDGAGSRPAGLVLAYPIVHPELPAPDEPDAPWYVGFTPEAVVGMNRAFAGSDVAMADPHAFAGLADLKGMPPTLIINSENDSLRASGEMFAAQLERDGTPVQLVLEPGTMHGHLNDDRAAAAQHSIETIAGWIFAHV